MVVNVLSVSQAFINKVISTKLTILNFRGISLHDKWKEVGEKSSKFMKNIKEK